MIRALHGLKLYGKKLDVQREFLAGQELDNFLIAESMLHKESFMMVDIGGDDAGDPTPNPNPTRDPTPTPTPTPNQGYATTSRCSGPSASTDRASPTAPSYPCTTTRCTTIPTPTLPMPSVLVDQ